MQIPTVPYNILAIAPLGPSPKAGAGPSWIAADLTNLDEAIGSFAPQIQVPLPRAVCPESAVVVPFNRLKDFKPEAVLLNVPYLARLGEAARAVEAAQKDGKPVGEVAAKIRAKFPDLPLCLATEPAVSPAPRAAAPRGKIDDILAMVAMPGTNGATPAASAAATDDLLKQLEGLTAQTLKHIFDHPEVRALEAAWRGMELLLKQGEVKASAGLQLWLVSADLDALPETLQRLSKELVAEPPSLVLVDLPFDHSPRSLELLEAVTVFADELLAPTLCWVNEGFFQLSSWAELERLPYLKSHLEGAAYAKWQRVRSLPGAQWVTVCCNRVLARLAYGTDNRPRTVAFDERAPVWVAPVWAAAALVAKSLNLFGWPSRFTDISKVMLENLSLLDTGQGPLTTEAALSEDRILGFMDAGVTALVGPSRKDVAILPKETTLAGGSLKVQLFFGRVLGTLFFFRAHLAEAFGEGSLAENLRVALSKFWEKTGQRVPADLTITAGATDPAGGVPLTISLTPPTSLLPAGQRISISFHW